MMMTPSTLSRAAVRWTRSTSTNTTGIISLRHQSVVAPEPPSPKTENADGNDAATSEPDTRVQTRIDESGVAHVELARPRKLNGFDMAMFEKIGKMIVDLRNDRSLRAVILSGQGRGFSAGETNMPLVSFPAPSPNGIGTRNLSLWRSFRTKHHSHTIIFVRSYT